MKKGSKNSEEIMKAVAYVRVSSDDQVKGTSLDSQTDACRGYAKSNGVELSDENVFREDVVTNGDNHEAMLANAPKQKEDQYQVPKTIG